MNVPVVHPLINVQEYEKGTDVPFYLDVDQQVVAL